MACVFHSLNAWRLPENSSISKGWRMEERRCDRCGKRFTRRHSRAQDTTMTTDTTAARDQRAREVLAQAFERAGDQHAANCIRVAPEKAAARQAYAIPLHYDVTIAAMLAFANEAAIQPVEGQQGTYVAFESGSALEARARKILRADAYSRQNVLSSEGTRHDEEGRVTIGTAVSAMLTFVASEPTHAERVAYEQRALALEMDIERLKKGEQPIYARLTATEAGIGTYHPGDEA